MTPATTHPQNPSVQSLFEDVPYDGVEEEEDDDAELEMDVVGGALRRVTVPSSFTVKLELVDDCDFVVFLVV